MAFLSSMKENAHDGICAAVSPYGLLDMKDTASPSDPVR